MLAAEGDRSGQVQQEADCAGAGPAAWLGGWHLCLCSAGRVDSELGSQL